MFDQNMAMQSMMIHETVRQQNENMRSLQRMVDNENLSMMQRQELLRQAEYQRRQEEELQYMLYYDDN